MLPRLAISLPLAVLACSSTTAAPDGGGGSTGTGGAAACQAVLALDRTCTTTADCIAVPHQTNCCGQRAFIGIRASEAGHEQMLEAQCDATYPACGCAEGAPTTDDGSRLAFDGAPGLTCAQGICTTFAPACGGPCPSGTTCSSCSSDAAMSCTAANTACGAR